MNENSFTATKKIENIIFLSMTGEKNRLDNFVYKIFIHVPRFFCLLVIVTTKSHHYLPNKILNQTENYGNPQK